MWGEIAGALIGGAFGAAGQSSANSANAAAAAQSQAFNEKEAVLNRKYQTASNAKQMAFQKSSISQAQKYNTNMSNTSWQRGVRDMKKAGINPILAFSKGGASAPQSSAASGASSAGATAQAVTPKAENVLADTASSAMAVKSGMANIELINAQTKNVEIDTKIKGTREFIELHKRYGLEWAKKLLTGGVEMNSAVTVKKLAPIRPPSRLTRKQTNTQKQYRTNKFDTWMRNAHKYLYE